MEYRILAVDPGDKRIGIALSDLSRTIANPYTVINHVSRILDAGSIAQIAHNEMVKCIVVGQALDENGDLTPSARKAARLADAIRSQTTIPVVLWDESGSTQAARSARIAMNVSRRKRQGHMDEIAATVILQSYLDVHSSNEDACL